MKKVLIIILALIVCLLCACTSDEEKLQAEYEQTEWAKDLNALKERIEEESQAFDELTKDFNDIANTFDSLP